MAKLDGDPERYLKARVTPKSRVLLINPPVHERRYHWLRWNQPSELLHLSAWLKARSKKTSVRLFDFMFPDENGDVPKQKVKSRDPRMPAEDVPLWHFGAPFEQFETTMRNWRHQDKWSPDIIIITSLTSYWHVSIERLVQRICGLFTSEAERKRTQIALYGNYPIFEPAYAATTRGADVAFTKKVDTRGLCPDFALYLESTGRPPLFFGLDIEDKKIDQHLAQCLDLQTSWQKKKAIARPATITAAFLNENVCSEASQLEAVAKFVAANPRKVFVDGISGIEPRSLTRPRLEQMKLAGFRSLFVEHARRPGGDLDVDAYSALRETLIEEQHAKQAGRSPNAWLDRGSVTGFVAMGLPDDDIDCLVRSTVRINSYFQSIILKPFGYSPSADSSSDQSRRSKWAHPFATSPQWFPYAEETKLTRQDYANLLGWQNMLNKRVKGSTFDFLGDGKVAHLVRETLIAESWKRRREAR
jgi:hypothetical protein